jgi:catechol 2,3-dioxygenase
MGVSSHDLFGSAGDADVAVPGSYGIPPQGVRLPPGTRLGPVRLQVAHLDRSRAFYEGVLGLHVTRIDADRMMLTAHGSDDALIVLHERQGARPAPRRGRLGLFHVAILLPYRAALGRFVQQLADIGVRAGAGDHLVSEAFYLQDPDNLGIEVYADRPRSSWRRVGRELQMATDPVDVDDLVRAAEGRRWEGMPSGTVIGHVHLHVGDLATAAGFYGEGLGFDRMAWSYPGALFLAADGYHHHVGLNTWAGPGAQPPGEDEAQLLEWSVVLPEAAQVAAVAANLAGRGYGANVAGARSADATEHAVGGDARPIVVRDPWGTRVRILSAATANGRRSATAR